MSFYKFGVITEVPPIGDSGNLALALPIFQEIEQPSEANDYKGVVQQVGGLASLKLRAPVFTLGEILILGPGGREVAAPGRKPSKWDVKCEEFEDLDKAVARANEVIG